jgi:hypothetical protein
MNMKDYSTLHLDINSSQGTVVLLLFYISQIYILFTLWYYIYIIHDCFFYLIMLEVLRISYLNHLSRILSSHALVYSHPKWWYFESWIKPEFMLLVRKMVNKHKNECCMMVMHNSDVISDYSGLKNEL